MTDNAPGWQTDPTGRHDHRYWDGSQWTEHVSDAGVATTDPYEAGSPATPDATAPQDTPTATGPVADDSPTLSYPVVEAQPSTLREAIEEPAASGEPAAASDPEPAADGASATTADTAGDPAPEPTSTDTPAASPPTYPSYSSPVPPVSTDPDVTAVSEAIDAPAPSDEPTVVQPVSSDPTTEGPATSSLDDAPPPPTFTPPAPSEGDGDGSGGSKRPLLIGVGLLLIIAVIVGIFALGGDDKGDLKSSIAKQIREGGQSGLDKEEAECLADELIKAVGADKLEGVDFTADEPPAAIADELNDAFVAAIPTCDIDLGASDDDDDDDTDDDGTVASTGGATNTTLSPEQVDEFRDLLAGCLADTMADAIEAGELDEDDSFDQFFEYLDSCDISVSDLGGAAGPTP
jgi:hypothetical protein